MRLHPAIIKKINPESLEQMAVIEWICKQHPWLREYTMAIPNERKTSKLWGYVLKLLGLLPGASDLFIAWPTLKYSGFFLEMKTKKGRPTKLQLDFLYRMKKVGYQGAVAYGADEAISMIKEYLAQPDNQNSL